MVPSVVSVDRYLVESSREQRALRQPGRELRARDRAGARGGPTRRAVRVRGVVEARRDAAAPSWSAAQPAPERRAAARDRRPGRGLRRRAACCSRRSCSTAGRGSCWRPRRTASRCWPATCRPCARPSGPDGRFVGAEAPVARVGGRARRAHRRPGAVPAAADAARAHAHARGGRPRRDRLALRARARRSRGELPRSPRSGRRDSSGAATT